MIDRKRVLALLRESALPDVCRRRIARAELCQMGSEVMAHLKLIVERNEQDLGNRAAGILSTINEAAILQEWREYASNSEALNRIEEGAIRIARCEYPFLSAEDVQSQLDRLAEQLRAEVPVEADPLRTLDALVCFLFEQQGFDGNQDDYYDPRNSFLNDVLQRRRGIPISLSVLTMAVSRRIGLPLEGVGLPGHFVVSLQAENDQRFIDVFNRGKLLSEEECRSLVQDAGLEFSPAHILPVTHRSIYLRMLRNLVAIYQQTRQFLKSLSALNQLLILAPDSPMELYLRATILGETGDTRSALADLDRLDGLATIGPSKDNIQALRMKFIARSN